MNSGKILYGNIDTLGWVVIKGMNFLDIDKATETLTHLANQKTWHAIHSSEGGAKRCQLVDYVLTSDVSTTNMEDCLLYTSPSPRDGLLSRMPSSA